MELKIGIATVENRMEFPQKIKNRTALWPSNSTSGNTKSKDYMYPYVHCCIIYINQDLEAAQVPVSVWVDKKAVVHLYSGILLGH